MMIAIAVIALMTLTAGVAAAASMKAHKVSASGDVTDIFLDIGSFVGSKFKIKDGVIKSVKISTVGENVVGEINLWGNTCEEKGKHSVDACDAAFSVLDGASVESNHSSKTTLKVLSPIALGDHDALLGTLKGSLKAELTIGKGTPDELTGTAKLKIRSTETPSIYQCLIGVDPSNVFPPEPVFGDISDCVASPGPNMLGLYSSEFETYLSPVYPFPAINGPESGFGPVLVPVVLFVEDTGSFKISGDTASVKGKLKVVITSVGGNESGSKLFIEKAKVEISADPS